jgi:hypothetical protein
LTDGWIVISAMYLSLYFYQRQNKYLTIENGFIKENSPFERKYKQIKNLLEITSKTEN